jgi:hypothetical protein
VNRIQAEIIKIGLELEIRTWDTSRMQMSRESSLNSFKRLSGIDTGRGLKGRQLALDIINNALASEEVSA